MTARNTASAWGSVARTFHWLVAALIFLQFTLGWVAEEWHRSPTKVDLFVWHKSTGILILTLVVLRLAWRAATSTPAPPAESSRIERLAASANHALLYLVMIGLPMSGWVINSAANFPLKIYWLVPLPAITAPSKSLQHAAEDVHETLVWTLAVLVIIHVAAALRHHFIKRNDVLTRMLPGFAGGARQSDREAKPRTEST
jgi:cytochrome b561